MIPTSGHGDEVKPRKFKVGNDYFRHTITVPSAFVSVNFITVNSDLTELGNVSEVIGDRKQSFF